MVVKELIEKLKDLNEDMQVVVQYRDSGGDYVGEDTSVYCIVLKEENKVVL